MSIIVAFSLYCGSSAGEALTRLIASALTACLHSLGSDLSSFAGSRMDGPTGRSSSEGE